MRKPKTIVLDSWAVMAYLEDEPAGERVADIISDAHDDAVPLMMAVVNAGEIWYLVARRTNAAEADRTITLLRQLGIKLVAADWPFTNIAATFKVKGNISYADCFAAALAKQNKASLVTGDREFKQLEKEISISWL